MGKRRLKVGERDVLWASAAAGRRDDVADVEAGARSAVLRAVELGAGDVVSPSLFIPPSLSFCPISTLNM